MEMPGTRFSGEIRPILSAGLERLTELANGVCTVPLSQLDKALGLRGARADSVADHARRFRDGGRGRDVDFPADCSDQNKRLDYTGAVKKLARAGVRVVWVVGRFGR